jgi:hypothetical protein
LPDGICPFAEFVPGVLGQGPAQTTFVGFCDHTAGGFLSTMRRASFWNDPNGDGSGADKVSTHFAVGRGGEVVQMVNIFQQAWAQGRDGRREPVGPTSPNITFAPFAEMGMRNPNTYLISTEHEDAITVNDRTVFVKDSEWTPEQYAADLKLKRWCVEEVKRVTGQDLLRFGIDSLAGHHMFDPVNRKECPGKKWRDEYRARLFHDLTEEDDIMKVLTGFAPFWNQQTVLPEQTMLVRVDFPNLPPEAKMVRLEVFLLEGMLLFHHGGGEYAGQVGFGDGDRAYGFVDVSIGNGEIKLAGPAKTERIGVLGWW